MSSAIAELHATALTARCHNAFFRQKQLKALHDALRRDSSTIRDAIRSDTRVSEQEATVEIALSLDLVRAHYAVIDPARELEDEYRVSNGRDAQNQTQPWGVVYIESQRHTPLFSIVAALSAAMAAGNCVALKLDNNLRALPSLLRTLLAQALESDTFALVLSAPSQDALATCFQVLQETHVQHPTSTQLASPQSKVIAIVDRTADIVAAAEHLVTARFAFGGSSPYAPDLVFVNEYVKKEFLEHALRFAIPYLASDDIVSNGSPKSPTLGEHRLGSKTTTEALKSLETSTSWRTSVVTQGSMGAIVDLSNLSFLPARSNSPVFAVSAITSLEHAISLIDEDSESASGLLAGYYFGTPSAGKYLSQFVRADASFVNHVPYRLLLGPAGPAYRSIDIDARYAKAHFTRPSPAFITAARSHAALAKVLCGKDARKAAAEALSKTAQEINEKKRVEWIAIGYFEQGILIGLGLFGIPLLTCIGTGLFFGARAGLRRFSFM
ncbi:ALDH-like protein [Didymella exigua CBS 183.55]|uniref:ALDH-like protein n=1 Tax=Didymella exigua CBS 183.55 TaxID=1150837 RepID=A0A6A5S338_9PLEO|nr:ALDH-like protein [Didymella exigua CBS 183.55]KAF1933854.1 ALDH-like protein [Didymella exigua CBS 183.55]